MTSSLGGSLSPGQFLDLFDNLVDDLFLVFSRGGVVEQLIERHQRVFVFGVTYVKPDLIHCGLDVPRSIREGLVQLWEVNSNPVKLCGRGVLVSLTAACADQPNNKPQQQDQVFHNWTKRLDSP